MKRWKYHLAAAGVLLLLGWGLHRAGWFFGDGDVSRADRPSQIQNADPMDTSSGWRYRQHQPHHWRYIMLQN